MPHDEREPLTVATTRERQLVAIAEAYLRADDDELDVLVREHLADYPDAHLRKDLP